MQTKFVTLGEHRVPVVSQRHTRWSRAFSFNEIGKLTQGNFGQEAYRFLVTLIPAIAEHIPEYEWMGYASREAYDSDEYDEAKDRAPYSDEIELAFEAILEVNGITRAGKLLELARMAERLTTLAQKNNDSSTTDLPSSPGRNGESPSRSTGTTVPTSTPSGESPAPVS